MNLVLLCCCPALCSGLIPCCLSPAQEASAKAGAWRPGSTTVIQDAALALLGLIGCYESLLHSGQRFSCLPSMSSVQTQVPGVLPPVGISLQQGPRAHHLTSILAPSATNTHGAATNAGRPGRPADGYNFAEALSALLALTDHKTSDACTKTAPPKPVRQNLSCSTAAAPKLACQAGVQTQPVSAAPFYAYRRRTRVSAPALQAAVAPQRALSQHTLRPECVPTTSAAPAWARTRRARAPSRRA